MVSGTTRCAVQGLCAKVDGRSRTPQRGVPTCSGVNKTRVIPKPAKRAEGPPTRRVCYAGNADATLVSRAGTAASPKRSTVMKRLLQIRQQHKLPSRIGRAANLHADRERLKRRSYCLLRPHTLRLGDFPKIRSRAWTPRRLGYRGVCVLSPDNAQADASALTATAQELCRLRM